MMRHVCGLVLAGAAIVGGCASMGEKRGEDTLVGTWQGREATPETPFHFASVTFAPDGTYTAQMRYRDQVRADSGKWSYENGTLNIGEGDRRYTAEVRGDELVVTEPKSKITAKLDRME